MFPGRADLSPLRLAVGGATVLAVGAELALHHRPVETVLGAVLIVVLGVVTTTDLESRRIPNVVIAPAAVLAILIGLVMHPSGLPTQAFWGLVTGAFLFLFALFSGGGLGMGDVKLGLVMGLFLGRSVVVALAIGLGASAVFSIGVLIARGISAGRKVKIPLGPFLALGGVVAVLAGPALAGQWGGL